MSFLTWTTPTDYARRLGAEHGDAAARSRFDGNTSIDDYRACVTMDADGAPEWSDYFGAPDPLSGEWADALTPRDLARECGLSADDFDDQYDYAAAESELCEAYEQAHGDAYRDRLLTIARPHVYRAALSTVQSWSIYRLATEADCGHPDTGESAGAVFLDRVRDNFCESVSGALADPMDDEWTLSEILDRMEADGVFNEMADNAPDAYTHRCWLQFVDLCAYEEDPSDYVSDSSGMTRLASACLYIIAERLITALCSAVCKAAGESR